MPQPRSSESPQTPDDAMNRALASERQALDAIEVCEQEAQMDVESARQQARSLSERTDRRIRDLHLRCVRATQEIVDTMVSEDAREAEQTDWPESREKALAAAVDRLANRLTSRTSPDGRQSLPDEHGH